MTIVTQQTLTLTRRMHWPQILLILMLACVQPTYAALPSSHQIDDAIAQRSSAAESDSVQDDIDTLLLIKGELAQISTLESQINELQLTLKQAPQRKAALQKLRDALSSAAPVDINKSASLLEIEQQLATQKARSKTIESQLTELANEQTALLEAQETLPSQIADQELKAAELSPQSRALTDAPQTRTQIWFSEVTQALAKTRLKSLRLQQDTLAPRRELASLKNQQLHQQLLASTRQIEQLHIHLFEARSQSSSATIDKALQLSRVFADAPAVILTWNKQNEALAYGSEALDHQLTQTQKARNQLELQRQQLSQNLAQIKNNLHWLKNSPAFSDTIRAQLAQLPQLPKRSELAQSINDAHLNRFERLSELTALKDIPATVDDLAQTNALSSKHQSWLNGVVSFRVELLTATLEKIDQYLAEMTRLDALSEQFSGELTADRNFLREQQLFIRGQDGLWSILTQDRHTWLGTQSITLRAKQLTLGLKQHVQALLLLAAGLSVLFAGAWQLRKMAQQHRILSAKWIGQVSRDAFGHTLLLILLACGYGGLLAGGILIIGYWIATYLPEFNTIDLQVVLRGFAIILFCWESMMQLARPQGVLIRHFDLPERSINWLAAFLSSERKYLYSLLSLLVSSEAFAQQSETPLQRIVFLALLVWLTLALRKLLNSRYITTLLPALLQTERAKRGLKVVVLTPLLLILCLVFWGYVYAAWQATFSFSAIFLSLLGAVFIQQIGVRWLTIEQRKLTLDRAKERRQELLKRISTTGGDASLKIEESDEKQLPVEAISEQSMTLLNVAVTLLLIGLLFTLLSDSWVALQWMDEVTIWEVITETAAGNQIEAVSLKAVMGALVILVLSLLASRNLPGLLELLVLHRLSISTGAAYATTTLLRYCLVIGGVIASFSALGFHWSKLQWLVAAFGVGLGFGLQEIFANLVSGIILLFERPVRVGDTVTISGLSGTVARINTRATTIIDWDRKEIVVPNKALITEQLVNWSLTDAVTRVVIPIGVAYGSDVSRVKALLLQAADECELVHRDPASQALFLAFGASSLDFELRVFIGQISQRVVTQDWLNTRIDALFREHHVEIAFPQLDVHLRQPPPEKA
jgi:potassium efflux system protein